MVPCSGIGEALALLLRGEGERGGAWSRSVSWLLWSDSDDDEDDGAAAAAAAAAAGGKEPDLEGESCCWDSWVWVFVFVVIVVVGGNSVDPMGLRKG